jgi:polysaccharide export outer membrane protein
VKEEHQGTNRDENHILAESQSTVGAGCTMRRQQTTIILILIALSTYLSGCGNKFFDPKQIGRFRPTPAVNVILDSLGVAEEAPTAWEGAEDPRPIDVVAYETDYVLGPGDFLRVDIFELLAAGVPFTKDYVITETGKISVPEVGIVEVIGLTEAQLEEEIKRTLQPSILVDPSVTVALLRSERRMFSVLGDGVPDPGRYPIPRYDFRLTDALALAGSPRQFFVSNIYVSRSVPGEEANLAPIEPEMVEPEEAEEQIEPGEEMLELIAPQVRSRRSERIVVASTEMITDEELEKAASPEGLEPLADRKEHKKGQGSKQGLLEAKTDTKGVDELPAESFGSGPTDLSIDEEQVRIEWIFENGKWIPVRVGRAKPRGPATGVEPEERALPREGPKEELPSGFGLGQIGAAGVQWRVIRIPVDKLLGGYPRYNIIIKPGDSIHVPLDVVGDFYIMGNVNFQGAISLTGRPMTLKMAIAAAGGLGELAWPKRCEVVRRMGKDEAGNWKEVIVMVDLDKIARGEQPDIFIKPNDLINVGTHPTARWRAALRNAFQATYGFSLIYNRNFAYKDYWGSRFNPINPLDWDNVF